MSGDPEQPHRRRHRAHGVAALRKLVAATAVSSLGDGLVAVALPLLALRLTKSALLIAALSAATQLPWLVVGLPAGVLIDRVNRRRLVVLVETGRAVVVAVVAVLAALRRSSLPELYVAAVLIGVGDTLVYATSRSVVPRASAGQTMVRAAGRLTAAQSATLTFAGPALGGWLFSVARSIPFVADALSYVASAGLLRGAVSDAERTDGGAARARTEERESARGELRGGLGWFAGSRALKALVSCVASLAFCQAVVFGVLVVYATRQLHLEATGYGLFLALAAMGNVAGSLGAAKLHSVLGPYLTIVTAGCLAASGYLALGSTSDRVVAVVALGIEAVAVAIGNVASTAARYRIIPAERFGVVSNAFRMFVVGATPLGSLCGGALAVAYGTRTTFAVAGALQLVALVAVAVPLRSIRVTEPPEPALNP